jgi:hypothetical protein
MKKPVRPTSPPTPLSAHALDVLRDVAYSPVPMQSINPGVTSRLLRDELIEQVDLPSPFKTHKAGKRIAFARVTEKGHKTVFPPEAQESKTRNIFEVIR